ncbi:MAG: PEGA domain-containing protein [Terriglobales bacterium]
MLKTSASIAILLLFTSLLAFPQQDSVQSNLQEAIAARYRLTQLGASFMSIHGGEDSIRKLGGTLLVVKKGLYGTQERRDITSNSIKNGQRTLLSGKDEVELLPGERFYANSVVVGQDFVTIGLLSVDPRNFQGRMGRVWAAVNFFFDKETVASGDLNKINAAMDQWMLPADSFSTAPPPTLAARMTTTPLAPSIELKPGASLEEIETGLGKPTQAIAFGNKTWLTYSGLVAVLEDGKLTSVERNEQAFGNLSLTAEKGAEIYIDGELAGTTPTTLRVPTGSHKVELKVAGKNVWEQQVHVFPGADVNLKPAVAGQ